MAAGALAEALGLPNSSLSFHLAHLTRARLIEQRREGRPWIDYTANYDAMNALVGFLTENCCGGGKIADQQSPNPRFVLSEVERRGETVIQRASTSLSANGHNGHRKYERRGADHGRQNLQRSLPLYREFGPIDHGRTILGLRGMGRFRAYSAGVIQGQPCTRPPSLCLRSSATTPTVSVRRAGTNLPGPGRPSSILFLPSATTRPAKSARMAGPADDRPFGNQGSCRRGRATASQAFWNAYQQLQRRIQLFLALPIEDIDELTCGIDSGHRQDPDRRHGWLIGRRSFRQTSRRCRGRCDLCASCRIRHRLVRHRAEERGRDGSEHREMQCPRLAIPCGRARWGCRRLRLCHPVPRPPGLSLDLREQHLPCPDRSAGIGTAARRAVGAASTPASAR